MLGDTDVVERESEGAQHIDPAGRYLQFGRDLGSQELPHGPSATGSAAHPPLDEPLTAVRSLHPFRVQTVISVTLANRLVSQRLPARVFQSTSPSTSTLAARCREPATCHLAGTDRNRRPGHDSLPLSTHGQGRCPERLRPQSKLGASRPPTPRRTEMMRRMPGDAADRRAARREHYRSYA